MGRRPKGWKVQQQENLDKKADKASGLVEIKHLAKITDIAEQDVTASDKKQLPKVIISTIDKHGNLATQVFVCASINLQKEETTTFGDGVPTKRKDYMHIVLEADVVKVEP